MDHEKALEVLNRLGCDFGPTVDPSEMELKGWTMDEEGVSFKHYLDPDDLNELSKACAVLADWLIQRASK
jgi:hypothetical protein